MSGKKIRIPKESQELSIPDSNSDSKEETVAFPVWFFEQVKFGKLRPWQEREVSVFFREKGLSDNETADKYSEILKLY